MSLTEPVKMWVSERQVAAQGGIQLGRAEQVYPDKAGDVVRPGQRSKSLARTGGKPRRDP